MDQEINLNELSSGGVEVPAIVKIINLTELKNFNQIHKGLNVQCSKELLMRNPTGYQNLLNQMEQATAAEGIKLTFTEYPEYFMVTFK